uniref:Glycine N-acyltransferase-like protein n=1 Tax=Elaeophora elaphi TaxID=1147741 RepID=A0A0R3RXI4_9BILA
MDEKQQEMILKKELNLPPEYYYNDDKPEEDAAIINDTWQYSVKGDYRSILQMLPNVIIRCQGQPVAYEMFSPNGCFQHHFVHEEHRRRGLGKHVELPRKSYSQTLKMSVFRDGIWPCKTVEQRNKLVIAWSDRSPNWNRLNDECGNPIIINFSPVICVNTSELKYT